MINGNEFAWEDIQVIIPGRILPVDGITAIEYTTTKEHVNIHGRGAEPVGMGRGKKDFKGSITLLQSVVEDLQAALPPGRDLTDLSPFTVTVGYAPEGGIPKTDQLRHCRIGEIPKGMKTGDPNKEIVMPLIIGKIAYNV